MKHEWKKDEKEWYGAKGKAALLEVPAQQFIMIDGKGNPNDTDFSDRVAALYSLAYAIKMAYKAAAKGEHPESITDFSVYPLEGVWKQKEGTELVKEKLEYSIMIRQPEFITAEMVKQALEKTKKKKFSPLLEEIRFDRMQDGACIEILHMGSFDDEPVSFGKMDEFAEKNGWKRIVSSHREIYLNHANRVSKDRLQTILRYQVQPLQQFTGV